jgi:hypothetical protein
MLSFLMGNGGRADVGERGGSGMDGGLAVVDGRRQNRSGREPLAAAFW